MPRSPKLTLVQDQYYAAGLSTDSPDNFHGIHKRYVLIVVDKAASVPDPIQYAIDGCLVSDYCRVLKIGNPTNAGCDFHSGFKVPTNKKVHISAFDIPNFSR